MIESAGFVIVDFSGVRPTALCLMSDWHTWDFPKGHVEAGENHLDAAFRETEEESGLTKDDYFFSGAHATPVTYPAGKDMKTATYFFAERTTSTAPWLPINPELGHAEHIVWRWIGLDKLRSMLPRRLLPVIDELEQWCYDYSSRVPTLNQE